MSQPITLIDLAADINHYLRSFAADLHINKPVPMESDPATLRPPYQFTSVCRIRGGVSVTYDPIYGQHRLPRVEAEHYLAWLEAGNVGKHSDMKRLTKATPAVPKAYAVDLASVIDSLANRADSAEDEAKPYMDIPCANDKRSTLLGLRDGLRIALLMLEDSTLPKCMMATARGSRVCFRHVHTGRHFDRRLNGWTVVAADTKAPS